MQALKLERQWRTVAKNYATVSTHALGWWRIALAAVVAGNTLYFWREADVFFVPGGVRLGGPLASWNVSPLTHLDAAWQVDLFFFATVLCALTFGLGIRGAKWLLPLFTASIYQAHPLLETGGCAVIQLALIYTWLLPVEQNLSWRSYRKSGHFREPNTTLVAWGYPLVLLQLAVNYGFNTYNKLTPIWKEGVAVARSLGNPTSVSEMGVWLAALPEWVLTCANFGTLVAEGSLPLLLLTPFFRRRAHLVAAFLMFGLHLMIALTLEVGFFGWAMLAQIPLLLFREEKQTQAVERLVSWPTGRWRFVTWGSCLVLVYAMLADLSSAGNIVGFNKSGKLKALPMPRVMELGVAWLNLHQAWGMFAIPLSRSFVTVTHAVTAEGTRFDPWRYRAADDATPLTTLPRVGYSRHMYFSWEVHMDTSEPMMKTFSDWTMRQTPPGTEDEHVVGFTSWTVTVPTERKYVLPLEKIVQASGMARLPFPGARKVEVESAGVWAPERATDGLTVRDGSHVLNPTGAAFAPGCAYLLLKLPEPTSLRSIYLQTDAVDIFVIEASTDGKTYFPIGKSERIRARQYRSRMVNVVADGVTHVRVRPERPKLRRGYIAEVALFSEALPLTHIASEQEGKFLANYDNPGAMGLMLGPEGASCPWNSDLRKAP